MPLLTPPWAAESGIDHQPHNYPAGTGRDFKPDFSFQMRNPWGFGREGDTLLGGGEKERGQGGSRLHLHESLCLESQLWQGSEEATFGKVDTWRPHLEAVGSSQDKPPAHRYINP